MKRYKGQSNPMIRYHWNTTEMPVEPNCVGPLCREHDRKELQKMARCAEPKIKGNIESNEKNYFYDELRIVPDELIETVKKLPTEKKRMFLKILNDVFPDA